MSVRQSLVANTLFAGTVDIDPSRRKSNLARIALSSSLLKGLKADLQASEVDDRPSFELKAGLSKFQAIQEEDGDMSSSSSASRSRGRANANAPNLEGTDQRMMQSEELETRDSSLEKERKIVTKS
jgi:hypothetical protein